MKYILLFIFPFLTFCSSNEKMIDVKDLEGKWKVVDADLKLKSTTTDVPKEVLLGTKEIYESMEFEFGKDGEFKETADVKTIGHRTMNGKWSYNSDENTLSINYSESNKSVVCEVLAFSENKMKLKLKLNSDLGTATLTFKKY
jgi:hypothetical protein